MTITIDFKADQEARLRRDAAREGVSVRDFVGRLLERYLAQSKVQVNQSESALLKQISSGLSEAEWSEYHLLQENREAEALTESAQSRLIALIDEIERANASRIGALAQLAALRGTSIDALMAMLDIPEPGDA